MEIKELALQPWVQFPSETSVRMTQGRLKGLAGRVVVKLDDLVTGFARYCVRINIVGSRVDGMYPDVIEWDACRYEMSRVRPERAKRLRQA